MQQPLTDAPIAYQYQQLISVGAGSPPQSEIAAKNAGVSGGTVSVMKAMIESGDDDLLETVLRCLSSGANAVPPPLCIPSSRVARTDRYFSEVASCRGESLSRLDCLMLS